ncbi:DegV family protein [uncultured Faecalibaculum sp.]|uniref:DegV family protein n=1 Tax=uncultured Faecalibaculum sp. TaxID=1729681 RepID=UPI0026233751|nr:DegV family protein [uncultured Faecalibaculum sp.]
MFEIITDSGCDLQSAPGLTVLPLNVTIDGQTWLDGETLSRQEFYRKLEDSDVLPKTSQIAPGVYEEAIRKAQENGKDVLVICLSSRLSGTYQSACLGASLCEGNVSVLDSESVTIGEMILVRRATELQNQGLSLEEAVRILEEEKKQIRLLALLDTLEYLQKGGRVSSVAAMAGTLLKIKPVVAVENGEVVVKGKARGAKKGRAYLTDAISASGIDFTRPVALGYTGTDDATLQAYLAENGDLLQGHEADKVNVGCAIGTHTGPGAIAAAWFEKKNS